MVDLIKKNKIKKFNVLTKDERIKRDENICKKLMELTKKEKIIWYESHNMFVMFYTQYNDFDINLYSDKIKIKFKHIENNPYNDISNALKIRNKVNNNSAFDQNDTISIKNKICRRSI